MSRYIDADAFVKNMSEIKESTLQNHSLKRGNEPIDGYDADFLRAIGLAKQLVDEFPATDVRPNVKGEWIVIDYGYDGEDEYPIVGCSECEYPIPEDLDAYNFCPNCGADNRPTTTSAEMRGEEQ